MQPGQQRLRGRPKSDKAAEFELLEQALLELQGLSGVGRAGWAGTPSGGQGAASEFLWDGVQPAGRRRETK
jgi:hypothetical protein